MTAPAITAAMTIESLMESMMSWSVLRSMLISTVSSLGGVSYSVLHVGPELCECTDHGLVLLGRAHGDADAVSSKGPYQDGRCLARQVLAHRHGLVPACKPVEVSARLGHIPALLAHARHH